MRTKIFIFCYLLCFFNMEAAASKFSKKNFSEPAHSPHYWNLSHQEIDSMKQLSCLTSSKNLKELDLSYNQLAAFSFELPDLKALDLSHNVIKAFSTDGLKELEALCLDCNELEELDTEGHLPLKVLSLAHNKPTKVDGYFDLLDQLTILSLPIISSKGFILEIILRTWWSWISQTTSSPSFMSQIPWISYRD